MSRVWRCRRVKAGVKCGTLNLRIKQCCTTCGGPRPKARKPAHTIALDMPYEFWVEAYGEVCGICGRTPTARRRLDRDHWHNGPTAGKPRGLLCARCNRAIPNWIDAQWLHNAARYLERASGTSEGCTTMTEIGEAA